MGKKRSWFSFVKRLFTSGNPKPKAEKKSEKWSWVFGKLKFKHYPALEAKQRTLTEATEEQRQHALVVAIATAAAAEAAVAAASAAAEVVRLANDPYEFERRKKDLAATQIQTAYRRHLARKALNALKGVVKLQAVIRGEIVRRRLLTKLRSRPSLVKAQSRGYQLRHLIANQYHIDGGNKQGSITKDMLNTRDLKLGCKSQRNWDFRLVSKEDGEALRLSRQDALIKRERMKKYSFSHRELRRDQLLDESFMTEEYGRHTKQFNRFRKFEAENNEDKDTSRVTQLKLRYADKWELMEESNSPFSRPRRSFGDVKEKSTREDSFIPDSPTFPTYMAVTESAKAKTRSVSTPKQRLRLFDTYSGAHSPCKLSLSSWSSFNGELTNTNRKSITSHPITMSSRGHR